MSTSPSASPSPVPSAATEDKRFVVVNNTQEKEDSYDLVTQRNLDRPSGFIGSVAYMIKGALGAGILGAHCGYAASGYVAVPLTCLLAIYMCSCLNVLVMTAQVIYKRTGTCKNLSYSDVAEASFAISEHPKVQKMSKPFRYFVDLVICLDLFGSCCCYQLMIAGTIKQVVENSQETSVAPLREGYPSLKIYLLMIAIPMIGVCLIKHLDLLGKLSLVGNFLVLLCVFATVYYSLQVNPTMAGMKSITTFKGIFVFIGQTVFSMSCSGIVISIECNMRTPQKFTQALMLGMFFITLGIIAVGLFGYSAYGEASKSPVTFHFPMNLFPMILKIGIAVMLVITHAVNFWVPFNLLFRYLKKLHREERHNFFEYIYRSICCFMCTCIGLVFPSVNKLMGFLGAFCLSNMAFIFPAIIWLVVFWDRPGLGKGRYRLFMSILIIFVGLIMFSAGTFVSVEGLISLFGADQQKIDELDYPDTHEYDDFQ